MSHPWSIYFCYRTRPESCGTSSSKACREKLRRDKLNDKWACQDFIPVTLFPPLFHNQFRFPRFIELGSILEPGRPPKTDKSAILVDAVRMVTQLRGEAQKLKDSNSNLQEKIKELKVNYTSSKNNDSYCYSSFFFFPSIYKGTREI